MNQAVIGLGSNIHPAQNIARARSILSKKYQIVKESSFTLTAPIGNVSQDDYINGAVLLETTLTISSLRGDLKKIEINLGRDTAQNPYAPRTIDLDIIIFNQKIIDPDFYKRDFLKKSVLELLPQLAC